MYLFLHNGASYSIIFCLCELIDPGFMSNLPVSRRIFHGFHSPP